ncbi:hypothetical protein [Serratia proteamaculans]|uniref:hypothetical protein n=1 Tax=Serratia proteamaculans TaxID=28151 RepID=UPI0010203B02|nr:hypothetical protein [Serratia proteamaculans]RYM55611.1 hypothetical protein BSQ96_02580 [Serratia proteamaculans]
MKECPVIFNGEMVRAILDGRKTQTRRIMKVQPESPGFGLRFITESLNSRDAGKYFWSQSDACGINKPRSKPFACQFGQVGDRLWVRETFAAFDADWKHPGKPHDLKDGPWPNVVYPASVAKIPDGTCRPSIHMPRWASRILLEITAVRVERLNDISEEDARAEGISDGGCLNCGEPEPCGCANPQPDATDAFAYLWQSIYGVENWLTNPWVWVIEFKRVEAQHG